MNGAARSGGSAGPGPKASPGPRATAMARSRRDSFDAMAGKEETRIERVGLRLAGLDSYATLTSLTAGLSTLNLSDLSSVFADDAPHPTHEKVAILVSLILQTLTISLGLHATLVFSMTSLYAKTAIGGGHDDAAALLEHALQLGQLCLAADRYEDVATALHRVDHTLVSEVDSPWLHSRATAD